MKTLKLFLIALALLGSTDIAVANNCPNCDDKAESSCNCNPCKCDPCNCTDCPCKN